MGLQKQHRKLQEEQDSPALQCQDWLKREADHDRDDAEAAESHGAANAQECHLSQFFHRSSHKRLPARSNSCAGILFPTSRQRDAAFSSS